MDISIFTDKSCPPQTEDLKQALGAASISWWQILEHYVCEKYPGAKDKWSYPGKKYGWSYSLRDKKRAIIYLLPRDGFFKVAFVFGQKATDQILASQVSPTIKKELENARKYVEGRGIRIAVKEEQILNDIKYLVDIKLLY